MARSQPSKPNKRIRSILFADVHGYSQLDDEQLLTYCTKILPDIADILGKYSPLDRNTWGDGVVVFFENVTDAARCALEIRDLFRHQNWKQEQLPELSMRIALHVGEVYEGTDPIRQKELGIVGIPVILSARLEPVTPEGFVFATTQFNSLLSASQDKKIKSELFGKRKLAKHWVQEEQVYEISWNSESSLKESLNLELEKQVIAFCNAMQLNDPEKVSCTVWMPDADGKSLHCPVKYQPGGREVNIRTLSTDIGVVGKAFRTGRLTLEMLLGELFSGKDYFERFMIEKWKFDQNTATQLAQNRAYLGIPISFSSDSGNEVIGVLYCSWRDHADCNAEVVSNAEQLAPMFSIIAQKFRQVGVF